MAILVMRSDFGLSSISRQATIADVDMTSIIMERRAAFGKVFDVDGTTMRDMTDGEVLTKIFDNILGTIIAQVSNNLREQAARAAAASFRPIQVTIADEINAAPAARVAPASGL